MKKSIIALRYFFIKEDASLFYEPLEDTARMELLKSKVLRGSEYSL